MEIKKSKKADLEKTRGTSMLIGYIVALAVMFAAFEWTTRDYVETEPVVYAAYAQMEEEIVPITQPIFTANVKEAIYQALNENHIEIPFPQRDVYIRQVSGGVGSDVLNEVKS